MQRGITHLLLAAGLLVLTNGVPAIADDCPGGWQVIPGYHPSMGAPCQRLGLNSRVGTCQPGQAYETLCDDASGGRYKTCQGPRPCYRGGGYGPPPGYGGGYGYGPPGYGGGYGPPPPPRPPRGHHNLPPCAGWDYSRNQPCPPGRVNRDCSGGCDGY